MNAREWFEGVLGYRLTSDERNGIDYWERPDGMMVNSSFDGTFLGNGQENMIREFQSEWIEHVVKPMRGFGYGWGIAHTQKLDVTSTGDIINNFTWFSAQGQQRRIVGLAEIIDDNVFQASLDAAELVPEVKEKLEKWRGNETTK